MIPSVVSAILGDLGAVRRSGVVLTASTGFDVSFVKVLLL